MIALDVGDRRIGIAVSDPLGLTAQPLETYERKGFGPDTRHIAEIAARYDTDQILCGLPRNMDGTQGFQADKVREFAAQLTSSGLFVQYEDERLTTVAAERAMVKDDVSRARRKQKIDSIAAAMILQTYLDAHHREEEMAQSEEDDLLEMEDEEGNIVRFRCCAQIAYRGESYVLLSAAEEADDFEKDESVIMRVTQDDTGESCYESLDDESLIAAVYGAYLREQE